MGQKVVMWSFLGALVHPEHSLCPQVARVLVELFRCPVLVLPQEGARDEAMTGGKIE